LYAIIVQLKITSSDGKKYATDCTDTEGLLRIIQSIPSPKAEPFKQWLAKVGYERIEETQDPERSIDRAMENYLKLGYSKEWINQRLKSIEIRKELTDEWETRGVRRGQEFAALTDIITRAWNRLLLMRTKKWQSKAARLPATLRPPPPQPQAFMSLSRFCNVNISSRSRAASIKSRSRAAFSISFFVRPIAFSTCGMVW